MASSDNLVSMDAWTFRHSWMSEAFARDTETLTKALQKSLSNPNSNHSAAADGGGAAAAVVASILHPASEIPMAIGGSGGSGSDPETPVAMKRGTSVPVNGVGKAATKRKSRASKKTTTTFITADPANFRQMVQQVTGVRFSGSNGQISAPVLLKPEPQRPSVINRVQQQGCLPTLDTSAFLLDHHHHYRQQVLPPPPASSATSVSAPSLGSASQPGGGVDFDSFPTFPTLESWKVM